MWWHDYHVWDLKEKSVQRTWQSVKYPLWIDVTSLSFSNQNDCKMVHDFDYSIPSVYFWTTHIHYHIDLSWLLLGHCNEIISHQPPASYFWAACYSLLYVIAKWVVIRRSHVQTSLTALSKLNTVFACSAMQKSFVYLHHCNRTSIKW